MRRMRPAYRNKLFINGWFSTRSFNDVVIVMSVFDKDGDIEGRELLEAAARRIPSLSFLSAKTFNDYYREKVTIASMHHMMPINKHNKYFQENK